MRYFLFISIAFCFGYTFSQNDEIEFSKEQRRKMKYSSGSAFIQYSNFQPGNLEEIIVSVSGNKFIDSVLINCKSDTLIEKGGEFFDKWIRKDFGLESLHSPTTIYFFNLGLYSEKLMKSFLVSSYSSFLRNEVIVLRKIKRSVLKGNRILNNRSKRMLKKKSRNYKKKY